MTNGVTWRPATKADRQLLQAFTCAHPDGPDHEQLVQRYFRSEAIRHAGAPDSLRKDHRLLLVFDGDDLVGIGCHRRGPEAGQRLLVFIAVASTARQEALSNGQRASDVLWQVLSADMLTRDGTQELVVIGRVDALNQRALDFNSRIGLRPGATDARGLVICSGVVVAVDESSQHS